MRRPPGTPTSGASPHARSGRGLGVAIGLLVLGLAVYFAWDQLRPGPTIVEPANRASLDPDVQRAIEKQLAVVRGAPRDGSAHATLALVYEANELWTESERAWAAALSLEDRPIWAYHRAIVLTELGEREQSTALLEDVVGRIGDVAAAHHLLGTHRLEDGDLDAAEASFRTAARIAPGRFEPLVGLGEVHVQREEFAEAAAALEEALEKEPDNKSAHYALGLAYRGLGRMDEAQRELALGVGADRNYMADPLTAQKSTLSTTYISKYSRAVELIETGRAADGAAILEKLLVQRPSDTNVYNNLAAAYLTEGDFERALELLERLVAIEPDEFAAYINMAAACLGLNRPEEALVHANKAVALGAQVGQTHYHRARVLVTLGRLPEAHEALRESVRLDARDPMAFAALGEVSVMLDRRAEAVEHFQAAVAQAPDYLPAWVSLVNLHRQMGSTKQALDALDQAERIAPDHPRVVAARRSMGRGQ